MKKYFTEAQIERISDVFLMMGEVFFASFVARSFLGVEPDDIGVLLFGLILSIACWVLSIILVRRKKK